MLHVNSGDNREALTDFNRAIELDPNFSEAYNNRGNLRLDSEDRQGALADFNRAIELNPSNATAHYNRGLLRVDFGDRQGAVADLQVAADLFQASGDMVNYEKVREDLRRVQQ